MTIDNLASAESKLTEEEKATLVKLRSRKAGDDPGGPDADPSADPTDTSPKLLAGKYKTQEDLEKGYLELAKKLGSKDQTTDTEDPTDDEDTTADASEDDDSDGGAVEDEAPPASDDRKALSDEESEAILASVGGPEVYQDASKWAASNLEQDDIDAFNEVLSSGSAPAIRLAVKGIVSQYKASDYQGRKVVGKVRGTPGPKPFESREQLRVAQADPRYKADPAFRRAVEQRVKASFGQEKL